MSHVSFSSCNHGYNSVNITFFLVHYTMRTSLLQNLLQSKKLLCKCSKLHRSNVITYSLLKRIQHFSTDSHKFDKNDENSQTRSYNLSTSISSTHQVFTDENAEIIFDIGEKQETIDLDNLRIDKKDHNPYEGINLERGINGVFEIEELVSLLQKDNAKDIFVASVPSESSYVDYIVVVTGKSSKHMKALATFIRKIYKLKRYKTDIIPKIEGENSNQWIAIDLGNIALHIFSKSARPQYDLETLWSVGPDYDDKSKGTTEDIMDQYNAFLLDLEPLENDEKSETIKSQNS